MPLTAVETAGSSKPVFAQDFTIPYDKIQAAILTAIATELAKLQPQLAGVAKCPTVICPDVHWSLTLQPGFAFTKKGQPILKAFGDPQLNGAEVSVHTQADLSLAIHIKADTTLSGGTSDVLLKATVDLLGSAKINLWPDILSQKPVISIKVVSSNFGINSLHLDEHALGLLLVGPIGPIFNVFSSDVAKAAEDKINPLVRQALDAAAKKLEESANAQIGPLLSAKVGQASDLKNQVMNGKLPVINKSFQDLSTAFGVSFDVQTVTTPAGGAVVIITPRFAANAGGGKVTGSVRFPKAECSYWQSSHGIVPVGLMTINDDLQAKLGTPCAAIFGNGITVSGYLGASPAAIHGAKALLMWKASGKVGFTGKLTYVAGTKPFVSGDFSTLTNSTDYYECTFALTGLPNADIIEAVPSGVVAEHLSDPVKQTTRVAEVVVPGAQAVLDASWHSVPGITMGGPGSCGRGSGLTFSMNQWLTFRDRFNVDKCPQCGVQRRNGILLVTNPGPILAIPALKSVLEGGTAGVTGGKTGGVIQQKGAIGKQAN